VRPIEAKLEGGEVADGGFVHESPVSENGALKRSGNPPRGVRGGQGGEGGGLVVMEVGRSTCAHAHGRSCAPVPVTEKCRNPRVYRSFLHSSPEIAVRYYCTALSAVEIPIVSLVIRAWNGIAIHFHVLILA
jgi:hypothetical protein